MRIVDRLHGCVVDDVCVCGEGEGVKVCERANVRMGMACLCPDSVRVGERVLWRRPSLSKPDCQTRQRGLRKHKRLSRSDIERAKKVSTKRGGRGVARLDWREGSAEREGMSVGEKKRE